MSGTTAAPPSPAAPSRSWRFLGVACRYALAVFFLMAAVSKVADLPSFRAFLLLHGGLPPAPAAGVAAVLPWLEMVCGLCLLSGRAAREAAALCVLLLVAFLVHGLLHPITTYCGCLVWPARLAPPPKPAWLAARNLFLMACAVRVAFWSA